MANSETSPYTFVNEEDSESSRIGDPTRGIFTGMDQEDLFGLRSGMGAHFNGNNGFGTPTPPPTSNITARVADSAGNLQRLYPSPAPLPGSWQATPHATSSSNLDATLAGGQRD